ncbi:hypothetical protein ACEPAF_8182 [Sanghuangporus sanghuang]
MSWVIGDSEDESEFVIPANRPVETHSSISDFTSCEIVLPANVSVISDFTSATSTKSADTTIDSIIVPSTSVEVPVKPKRPKPRPAYKGAKTATVTSNQSSSSASMVATVINQTSMVSVEGLPLDAGFSFGIAESAKMRKRASTEDRINASKSDSSPRKPSSVIEGSSKDLINLCSSDAEPESIVAHSKRAGTRKPSEEHRRSSSTRQLDVAFGSDAPFPPSSHPSSSSVVRATRLPSPPPHTGEAPPWSPFEPRKKKRKTPVEDFDSLEDSGVVENVNRSTSISAPKEKGPSAKKHKKDKEKKSRLGRSAVAEGNGTSHGEPSKSRKRQSKVKDKALEQDFKSKEFVEDSEDDDLLLVPRSSKSASRISYSDPASIEVSVRASIDASIQPSAFSPEKSVVSSTSVLPSASTSVRPSAVVSGSPSTHLSAPPPSPSAPRSKKSKSKKKKDVSVSRTSNAIRTSDSPDYITTNLDSGGPAIAPEKGSKKSKTGPSVSPDGEENLEGLPAYDHSDSAEQYIPVAGKSRSKEMKDRKKQRAIVSSDEDEPEAESCTKINPVEMEVDRTRMKESAMSADKENQVVPTPKDCYDKVPEPSTPSSAVGVQPRASNPRSHCSTPKIHSRKDSMSALIRRVSSKVQSPLGTPSPVHMYSPLAKASRTVLSRIAPLHPNRRTPPPPPPRPPAPKKSKKMLELEEKWEMELAESVDGWSCMTDEERAALRRAKRDAELGYDD